jgi:hypothetical protein
MNDLKNERLGKFAEGSELKQPAMFRNHIQQTVTVARGADVDSDIRTFKGKYGTAYSSLVGLTDEIFQKCETKKP